MTLEKTAKTVAGAAILYLRKRLTTKVVLFVSGYFAMVRIVRLVYLLLVIVIPLPRICSFTLNIGLNKHGTETQFRRQLLCKMPV
jgi:hypothetical protein